MSQIPEPFLNDNSIRDFESVVVAGFGERFQQLPEALVHPAVGGEAVEPQGFLHLRFGGTFSAGVRHCQGCGDAEGRGDDVAVTASRRYLLVEVDYGHKETYVI